MSKLVVKDTYHVRGRGIVIAGVADCKPKPGPASITNPDGTYWETILLGVESHAIACDRNKPRPVGLLCSAIKDGDVKRGAVVRFTPDLE